VISGSLPPGVVVLRVAGIDPGTRSFDVVVLEDGRVVSEHSFDTLTIARSPERLIDLVKSIDVDVIVAPSGYGVPVTWGRDVVDARRFALELLLLSKPSDMGFDDPGVNVYKALAEIVVELLRGLPDRTLFIPSVILLPTVPWFRKVNKIDMGTADKLASTVLAVHQYSLKESLDYGSVNLVVVETGYGYTGVISVKEGLVVDGIGGTSACIGPLTAGALDLEVVAGVGKWDRWSILRGGLVDMVGVIDIYELVVAMKSGDERARVAFEAYVECIVKDVSRALISTPKAEVVVVTGRNARIPELREAMRERLGLEVVTVEGLPGAGKAKESAQGYAMIGDGIAGGVFRDIVDHMRIEDACGTVADYIIHPGALGLRDRIRDLYRRLVVKPKFCNNL
jgi:predicted butyrate kinase (DUF1464 family)